MRKALEEAIRFEIDGREFFLKAEEQAKSYFAKLIFKTIAEEELGHIERVKEIYNQGLPAETIASPPQASGKRDLENVFQQAMREIDPGFILDANELQALRLAIQLEMRGHEFYQRLAEEASNEFERMFFHQLAQEEERHFSILHQMEEVMLKSTGFG